MDKVYFPISDKLNLFIIFVIITTVSLIFAYIGGRLHKVKNKFIRGSLFILLVSFLSAISVYSDGINNDFFSKLLNNLSCAVVGLVVGFMNTGKTRR